MGFASAFQSLPLHIAESIAHYFVSTGLSNYCYEKSEKTKQLWTVLYKVSYSWRVIALQHLLKNLTLSISMKKGTGQFEFHNLPKKIKIDASHSKYVNRIDIIFKDAITSNTGKVERDFSAIWPPSAVFPSVRSLSIDLSGFVFQKFDDRSTTEDERLHWITKHIQTSMPKLQEVTITDCGHYNRRVGEPAYYRWKVDKFLSAIFDKATALIIKASEFGLASDYGLIQTDIHLGHLECHCDSKNSFFGCLIAKCASILESLKLIDAYLENARSFFFDSKNRPIVYPRLHKLEFYSGEESELDKPPRVDKSIAPFPVLRYLKWRSVYIFKDDTLFRGNSGTLEYLDIEVGTRLDDVIRDYSVFADGKYSRICHVSVRKADVYHVNSPSLGELMKIANGIISPKTMSIVLEHDFLEEDDIGILCECPYLENIQALNLGKTELELKDLVKLVKVFPNMTTLICTPGTIDFEPYSLLLSNFISDLYEEHYPLSQRLRRWHAVMDIEESAGLAVPSAILLAIICPNFVLASVPSEHLYMFNSVIKIAIKLGFYSDHINKIRRLLPNTD